MIISMIAAMGKNRAIGLNGGLPWDIPSESHHFWGIASGHLLLLGRKNYQCHPDELDQHRCFILTRSQAFKAKKHKVFQDPLSAIKAAKDQGEKELFVLGGSAIFEIMLPYTRFLHLSVVDYSGPADTYFPSHEDYSWQEKKTFERKVDQDTPLAWRYTLLEKLPENAE